MTSYGAYDAGLPCKNTACKSHGRSHPNCKCYPGLADGGEVSQFCSEDRKHQSDCEYFAGGGDVLPDQYEAVEDTPPEEAAPAQEPAATPAPEEPATDALPEQYEAVDEDTELPDQYEPVDEEETPGELSVPHGAQDALHKLGTNGVLQEAPKEFPEGELIPRAEWDKMGNNFEDLSKAGLLITGGGGLIPGISRAADAVATYTGLGKAGSTILSRMITGGVIKFGDEASDYLLGRGDPNDHAGAALARIAEASGLSGLFGAGEVVVGNSLKALAASKIAGKLQSFLAGFASAAHHPIASSEEAGPAGRELVDASMKLFHESEEAPKGASYKAYQAGQKAFDKGINNITKKAVSVGSTMIGGHAENVAGSLTGRAIGDAVAEPIANMVESITKPAARKYVAPVILKMLASGNTEGLLEALGHAEQVGAGYNAITKGAAEVLEGGSARAGAASSEKLHKKVDEWIKNGGVTQDLQDEIYNQAGPEAAQGFAKGGEVKPAAKAPGLHNKGLAIHYPEQNMLLNTARGRISNYLSGLRPQEHSAKLAFDSKPDTTKQERTYHRAIDVAISPLSVLDEIKKGTLEPEHLQHLNEMHPEVVGLLKKKLTDSIVKAQVDGTKPPYQVRQALSLFMGAPLSSELTPANIQAAQNVFAMKKPPQQQEQGGGGKPSGSKSALSKSDQAFLTSSQALQKRQSKI